MNLLYVDRDGQVRAGWLTCSTTKEGEAAPALLSRTGDLLSPRDVLYLLAPPTPTEDQSAALWRAVCAGYRVEAA